MKIQEILEGATALSVAADALSQGVDVLIDKAEKVLAFFRSTSLDLPPEAKAVLDQLNTVRVNVGAHRDAVDQEVSNLDKALPSPIAAVTISPVDAAITDEPPPEQEKAKELSAKSEEEKETDKIPEVDK